MYEHYFLSAYPAIFALAGIGVASSSSSLMQRLQLWERKVPAKLAGAGLLIAVSAALVLIPTIAQAWFYLDSASYVGRGLAVGNRGIPIGDLEAAIEQARQAAPQGSGIHVITSGWLGEVIEPMARLELKAGTLGDGRTLAFNPRFAQQVYLVIRDSPAADFLRKELGGTRAGGTSDVSGEEFGEVFVVPTGELEATLGLTFSPVQHSLDNGVGLAGVEINRTVSRGSALTVALIWTVEQPPPVDLQKSPRFFVHLARSPEALQVAQEDSIGYPRKSWSEGDRVISWFSIPVPANTAPGEYVVRLGMYDLDSMRRATFLTPSKAPDGDFRIAGSVRVE